MTDVLVIINPVAGPGRRGRGAQRARIATATLEALGADGRVVLTERSGHAHELAREAAASAVSTVIAWGGDGTVNEVGCGLTMPFPRGRSGRMPSLGIVPGGSGNGLARELGLPFDPSRAIAHALASAPRPMDAGEIGGRAFFNLAGVGLDARVAAMVSTRRRRGLLPYLHAAVRDLLRQRGVAYTIEIDGAESSVDARVIAIANSRQYGLHAIIAPQARLDDGYLDLVAVEDRGLAGNLVRVPALFTGGFHRRRGVTSRRVRHATIRCAEPMLFHVDGEAVQGSGVLSVEVHPGALQIRA